MMKFHPTIALIFFVVGVLVCYGFSLLIDFGNSMAGAGDGASPGSIVPANHVIVPYVGYFLAGIIASLAPRRILRFLLAFAGHVSPFIAFATLKDINIGIVRFFLIVDFCLFIPFSFAWYKLLRHSNDFQ